MAMNAAPGDMNFNPLSLISKTASANGLAEVMPDASEAKVMEGHR